MFQRSDTSLDNLLKKRNYNIPIHEQICQYFIDRISSKMMKHGEKLPSVRQLSKELGVSLVTVQKAYQQLQQRGYVESFQGKGIFVKSTNQKEDVDDLHTSWHMLVPDYVPRAQSLSISQPMRNIRYNLGTASIHGNLLHTEWMKKTAMQVIEENPHMLGQSSSANGDLEFRKAVSDYLQSKQLSIAPEHILAVSGAQQGIELVAKTFIGPNDVVLMEAPTYPGSIDIFKSRGAQIIPIPVEQDGIDTKMLLKLCDQYHPKLLYINPTFQNPTGTTLSVKKRKELVDIAESYHFLILEDDPWSELYFEEKPPAPIKSFDTSGHVIYLKGFSKFLSPSCRIGALVAEGPLLEKLVAARSISDLGSPLLTQKIIAGLLQSKELNKVLQNLRTDLKNRAKQCVQLLHQCSSLLTYRSPSGGNTVWVKLPQNVHADLLLEYCHTKQLTFLPGSACFPTHVPNQYIRISFAGLPLDGLKQSMKILCDTINSLSSTRNQYSLENYPIF
ncbi:PLP-dependent aminotransferase family protein [Thermolongibacillus altinsuensis]|nr:PLP-dependent aminotransferase family protein [Thermolongibacillus altinsuensis]